VSSEIGAKKTTGRGWAVFALLFLVAFSFARWVLHERAVAVLESRIYNGAAPSRAAALPDSFNPLRWTGLVEMPEAYEILPVNLLGQFDPGDGILAYKPIPTAREAAAAEAARKTEAFQVFMNFSSFPYWRFSPADIENGIRVEAMDLRFCVPSHPRFVATAIVDQTGKVVDSRFSYWGEK
jgi:hypothetical protein